MSQPAVSSAAADLESIAWGFLESDYAGTHFTEWSIDRRLHAYLRHRGLREVADDGTVCAALLDRVMANISSALTSGTLRRMRRPTWRRSTRPRSATTSRS